MGDFDHVLPVHFNFMERVNSITHGLWYMMMTRGQGHLAHHALMGGFRLVECLRFMGYADKPLDTGQWHGIRACADALKATACLISTHLKTSGASQEYLKRIEYFVADLVDLSEVWARCPKQQSPKIDAADLATKEQQPCNDDAPSQGANGESPTTSLPVDRTGTGSAANFKGGSGPCTMTTEEARSAYGHSGKGKKPSCRKRPPPGQKKRR